MLPPPAGQDQRFNNTGTKWDRSEVGEKGKGEKNKMAKSGFTGATEGGEKV